MREPGHERGDRGELLRRARALGGLAQLVALQAQRALEHVALLSELFGEMGEPLFVPLDVRLDVDLDVEPRCAPRAP